MDGATVFGYIIGLLLYTGLVILIAEYRGRKKHIGRLWSILLLFFGGFIVGGIAIVASPKATQPPTKGNKAHLISGIISIIFFIILFFVGIALMVEGQESYNEREFDAGRSNFLTSITFLLLGIYLIQLYNGKIVNHNPRGNTQNNIPQFPNTGINTQTNNGNPIYNGGHNAGGYSNTQANNGNPIYNGGHNAGGYNTQANNGNPIYNGGHNAGNNTSSQKTQRPQQGKGEFNGDLYN